MDIIIFQLPANDDTNGPPKQHQSEVHSVMIAGLLNSLLLEHNAGFFDW
jgi:hypothetical protein